MDKVRIGQLVKFADHDAGGGFAPSPEKVGIIIDLYDYTSPPEVEILCASGEIIFQYGDELELIQ